MTQDSILKLAAEWEKTHPKRAKGGFFAIAGFRYQFHCVLRDAVRGWINEKQAVAPATEILSDILSQAGDQWTITQVKRTGTSGSLHKALDELWTIESVALTKFPDLLDSLRYEVRCAKWELSDVKASINRWLPGELTNIADGALEQFKLRVGPSSDPRPLDELASMLVRECQALDAFEWINRWTSRLIEVATDEITPVAFGRELYESLRLFQAEACPKLPMGIQSVAPSFAEPESVERGLHLVGEQPRLHHLEDGYFAPRNWQVEPATQDFLEWHESDPFGSDKERRLPVFWIAGRSGSGKSVLLLQFLARLSQSGIAPVLWLGNRRPLLSEAMKWGVRTTQYQVQPVIAIDDPFVPGEMGDAESHWSKTISQLEATRDQGDLIPIIVACGPTEQATAFQQEWESDVLIHQWILDEAADLDHVPSLKDWFEKRTGTKSPNVGHGETLMIQRFFEWRTGEQLSQFSQRFRGRVEALDRSGKLTQLVSELLAVNRLYCGLPRSAINRLSDQDLDALEPLKNDHHIVINRDSGRPGIWLAHPHLADALFRGWFGQTKKHQRIGALRNGILTCLEYGTTPAEKTAVLWAISKAWVAEDDLAQRVDRDNISGILEKVFPSFLNEEGKLTFSHYPVWIRLSSLIPDIRLMQSPVDMAIGEIVPERAYETGFRLTCHILLDHLNELGNSHDEILRVIRATLDKTPEWFHWPYVAENLTRISSDQEDGRRLLTWVSDHSNSRHVPRLLSVAMTIAECDLQSQQLASRMALSAGGDNEWANLLASLLQRTDTYTENIALWAAKNVLNSHSLFVLRELLIRDYRDAVELARKWVSHFPNSSAANFLIEPLCERETAADFEREAAESWVSPTLTGADRLIEWLLDNYPSPRIIRLAEEWLSRQYNAAGWAFVFEKLIKIATLDKERDAIIAKGLKWLSGGEDQPSWGHVFNKLLDAVSSDKERETLVEQGLKWLLGREDQPEWNYVFQKLIDVVSSDKERETLVKQGLKWLSEHEDQPSWSFAFNKLIEVTSSEKQLEALTAQGLKWLSEHENQPSWGFVFNKLIVVISSERQREALIAQGLKWLPGREDQPEWSHVYRKLIEVALPDKEREVVLVEQGLKWLPGREDQPEWSYVFQELIDLVSSDKELAALIKQGLKWLSEHEDHPSWGFVFNKLIGVTSSGKQHGALIEQGLMWLLGREDQPEWSHVYRKLMKFMSSDKEREVLISRGLKWLSKNEDKTGWSAVFNKLIKVASSDKEREVLVQQGLKQMSKNKDMVGWSDVFNKLIDVVSSDKEREALVEQGLKWMSKHKDQPGWGFVFNKLIGITPSPGKEHEALVKLGLKWLSENEDKAGWDAVFSKLIGISPSSGEEHEALVKLGLKWLPKNEAKAVWNVVFRKLIDIASSDKERKVLVDQGLNWILEREDQYGWGHVFNRLIDAVPPGKERKALIEQGLGLISKCKEHSHWGHLFNQLIDVMPPGKERKALIEQGLKWMHERENHPGWGFVLARLIDVMLVGKEREALIELGLQWLYKYDERMGWNIVFDKLIDVAPSDKERTKLINQGLKWVSKNEKNKGWTFVFLTLIDVVPPGKEREVLIDQGLKWASRHEGKMGWKFVSEKLNNCRV